MNKERLLELAGVLTEAYQESNEAMFEQSLAEAIEEYDGWNVRRVQTFRDSGMLSNNNGLVIDLQDGSQFQITIVQSA